MDDAEFLQALENKLLEKVQELRFGKEKAEKEIELADICEVIDALIRAYGFSGKKISGTQKKRRKERGGFEKRIFLERTE